MTSTSGILLERVRAATADEYTIESEIGRGGMAAVFLARDIALERRVAIKVMLPDLTDVAGNQDRFVIEARTAAHLDHPGIVTVYSVKQRAGLLFIVMKYLEGRTLEEVLRGSRAQDPAVVTAVVRRVAEALQFAHSEGVVHRDVKPSNIIIDARGHPVVTDFGIAKVMAARSITVAGSMIGTPAYMSPEQCRGLPATAASDQYALGVVTYEMLTGRMPFTGTIFELIAAHSSESPPPLRQLVPGINAALEETVMRMLAKNPSDRWGSLGEVVQRLGGSSRRQSAPPELDATIAAFARGEPTLELGPAAITVAIPAVSRAAATITTPTPALTPAQTPAPAPAPDIIVMPHEPTIEIGQSLQFHLSDGSGAPIAGVPIAWQSEDPTIATVDDAGIVTGTDTGYAKITVTAGAATGRMGVTVNAPSPALAAGVVTADVVSPHRSTTSRGVIFAGIAIILAVAVLLLHPWSQRHAPVVEPATPAAGLPSPVPDSAQVTSRDTFPPVPATTRTSKTAAPLQPDSSGTVAARRDSARAECPKLLERISLGEQLTDAETSRFKRLCAK